MREYRGRASAEVAIHRDGVVARVGGSRKVFAWADVQGVRFAPTGLDLSCILVLKAGGSFRLPPEVAPCSVAAAALEWTLVRGLARRLGRRIDAGGSIEVREAGVRSAFIIARGLIVIAVGVVLVLSLRYARRGAFAVHHGVMLVRQGRDGTRGGFIADAEGVRPLKGDVRDSIPWARVALIQADLSGIVLRSDDGRSIVASPFAEGFWPAAHWIASGSKT
jgi:hypothetical protein